MNPLQAPQDGQMVSVLLSALIFMGSLGWMVYEFTDEKSDETRADLVAQFNVISDAWEAPNDEKAKWNLIKSITATDDEDTTATLDRSTKGDAVTDKHPDVHTYDSSHFEGKLTASLAEWYARSTDLHLTLQYSSNTTQTLLLKNVTTTRVKTHRTNNWKQCQNTLRGSLNERESVCTTYEVLSEVCVVVATEGEGFRISGGCGKEGHTNEPVMAYNTYPSPRYDREIMKNINFASKIVIRADHDPILAARQLTHGTTKFGQTKSERLALGYAALGCAIVSGCMLAFSLYQWKTSTPPHKYTKHSIQSSVRQPSAVKHERESSNVVPRKGENTNDKEMTRKQREEDDMV